MIHSFIFSEGKLVGQDLELEALRLVAADKGLLLWVDLADPTPEETKSILEGVFQFHPLAIEDCTTPNSLPKVEDYEDYLFLVIHGVDYTRTDKFSTTELVLPIDERVRFDITSIDIVHSFWIPGFRQKLDAVPGRITKLYITPTELGDGNIDSTLRVQCAELCGTNHATMAVPVRVVSQEDFDAWLASIRKDG